MPVSQSRELAHLYHELYAKHRDTPTHVEEDFLDRKNPNPPYWLYLRALMFFQTLIGWLRVDGFEVDVEKLFSNVSQTEYEDIEKEQGVILVVALEISDQTIEVEFYETDGFSWQFEVGLVGGGGFEESASMVENARFCYRYFQDFMSNLREEQEWLSGELDDWDSQKHSHSYTVH